MNTIEQIEAQVAQLKLEGEKFFTKGNKSAGTRLRKLAMDITKNCKALRIEVLEEKSKA
jgi:hypothetical protein